VDESLALISWTSLAGNEEADNDLLFEALGSFRVQADM
jgi:hypothetical protein